MSRRDGVLLAAAGVILAAALLFWMRSSRAPAPPREGPVAALAMRCDACGARFELDMGDYEQAVGQSRRDPRAASIDPAALALPCPHCGQRSAVRAEASGSMEPP